MDLFFVPKTPIPVGASLPDGGSIVHGTVDASQPEQEIDKAWVRVSQLSLNVSPALIITIQNIGLHLWDYLRQSEVRENWCCSHGRIFFVAFSLLLFLRWIFWSNFVNATTSIICVGLLSCVSSTAA